MVKCFYSEGLNYTFFSEFIICIFCIFGRQSRKMNVNRLREQIHKSFDLLLESISENYHLQSNGFHNRLIEARNEIATMVWMAENEYVALKKFNVLIDFLSKENERIILNNIDTPYWMKGEIELERPPGITQKEFDQLIKEIGERFTDLKQSIQWDNISGQKLSIHIDGLLFEINLLLKDAFCLPNKNIKFTKGLYDRSMVSHPFFKQNTPCEICGENRAIDSCHIIPNHMGGDIAPGNVLWLCPTHHRLFDRFLLSREEYDKIVWQAKSKASANFAYIVFRPIFEKTWLKIEKGIYEKYGDEFNFKISLNAIETMILEMVNESHELDIKTISTRIEINQTECKKIVRGMASKGTIKISGKNNFKVHPIK